MNTEESSLFAKHFKGTENIFFMILTGMAITILLLREYHMVGEQLLDAGAWGIFTIICLSMGWKSRHSKGKLAVTAVYYFCFIFFLGR
ncbi:hypothetical protein [Bacillus massiliglaciei]|uniref:hypothetical protein n=1 Tax=Bacillus massiliglaciei TaxID=1816693 RepID=UPI000DA60D5E|nr:hypothetical protein [Bacillus massiliglaciei]